MEAFERGRRSAHIDRHGHGVTGMQCWGRQVDKEQRRRRAREDDRTTSHAATTEPMSWVSRSALPANSARKIESPTAAHGRRVSVETRQMCMDAENKAVDSDDCQQHGHQLSVAAGSQ